MKKTIIIALILFFSLSLVAQNPVEISTYRCGSYMEKHSKVARLLHPHKYRPVAGQDVHGYYLTMEARGRCLAEPRNLASSFQTHNLITNAGHDLISSNVFLTSSSVAKCNYIGLSAAYSLTPAVTDTTLSGEITSYGLSRAQATTAHTTGTTTTTETYTWTYNGANGTMLLTTEAVFNAVSSGTMCAETAFSAAPSLANNGDTLQVTHTFTH